MSKQYAEIKDEDIRRALVEAQPLEGNPADLVARKSPDFLVYGTQYFICFTGGTKDWRKIGVD